MPVELQVLAYVPVLRSVGGFLAALTLLCCGAAVQAQPELRSGFVEVEGGPLWYEIAGGGDGVPLLTLHGGPGGTSCGLQLLYPLADERRVIRYDQLGSGRSGRPRNPELWHRDRFVEALHTLRSELGLERMHLQGHSWGGALAAYYVLEKGGQGIVSLTLSSPLISTPLWIRDANALRARLDPKVQAVLDKHEADGSTEHPDYVAATEVFYAQFVSPGEAKEEVECPDAPRNSVIYNQMWGPTEFFATGSLQDFDLTPRLGEIDVPTLFVTGELDEARPDTVEGFAKLVPGARFEVIPGAGHRSISREPELYRKLLRDFMREAERGVPEIAAGYTAAWNSGDPDQVASFYTPEGALTINGGEPSVGRASVAEAARGFMEAFPDLVLVNDRIERNGDRINYHWTFSGTNTGPGGTGRFVKFSGYEAWILSEDGLIQDSLGSFDAEDYERQLAGE
jgi:proline iminopeptidase